ncbi:FHA domain-containing protein [Tundrisphaera sp. TA3]|uniref:FHA domain-containing protein n=1 Tax=Tundrisphaera sp. TA3 TaxID=3435775 RepID=UPI003EC13D7E
MDFQLVVLRGRSATTALKLGDTATTAGRGEDCQLRIKSSQVSRRHCQFFEKNGMLLVKDLGSSNGTFLNGKKIEGQRVLEPGDELAIGPVKLRVEKAGQPSASKTGVKPGVPKPGDTAVPTKISPGASSDEFEIDFDETPEPASEEKTVAVPPKKSEAKSTSKAAEPDLPDSGPAELGDDAIADFLLDIKLDDDE